MIKSAKNMQDLDQTTKKQILIWLGITLGMLFCMVFIGGVTRLTDSGLSMVEWRPLLGAIPPMNEAQWLEVFDKYKQFPEYQIVNQRMNLEEFKFIFFWEYFHRLFGRLIGVVFILPYLFFFLRRKLNKEWNRKLLFALFLGASQGLLGWFMVMSGLVDRPDVSHFRLAAHFSLAVLIIGYIFWMMLDLLPYRGAVKTPEIATAKKLLAYFSPVLAIQIVYGAFVAGLDAGIGYNTFPKMGRYWIPKILTGEESFLVMAVSSNVGVQFVHRCFGWALFAFAVYFLYFALSKLPNGKLRRDFIGISALVLLQFILGVLTLLTNVAISLASAHQMVACVLVIMTVKVFYDVTRGEEMVIVHTETAKKTTA